MLSKQRISKPEKYMNVMTNAELYFRVKRKSRKIGRFRDMTERMAGQEEK